MPVSPELLEILVCPETKQGVALAGEETLAQLNEKIAAGSVRNRGGDKVERPRLTDIRSLRRYLRTRGLKNLRRRFWPAELRRKYGIEEIRRTFHIRG